MYKSIADLLDQARTSGRALHELIIDDEAELREITPAQVREQLEMRYAVMQQSAGAALESAGSVPGSLISGQSARQNRDGGTLAGDYINRVMARALSSSEVNASMGLICAAPTAGACGILPAVLLETARKLDAPHECVIDALAVAGGFGAVITRNATVSGAEGGCQAECGVAAAMAAAAAVYLAGGTPEACAEALSLALIHCMGLVCDPVASLVQLPCSFRNASQSVNAIISADMALAGQSAVIPADEVIKAMYRVGRQLPPELRETARGGIAATPTARKIAQELRRDWDAGQQ